jgi:hypothetical protein
VVERRQTWVGAVLRAGGLLLIGGAIWVFSLLPAPAAVALAGGARAIDFVLALVGFLSGTIGTALLFAGGHLLDPVELGPRWSRFRR